MSMNREPEAIGGIDEEVLRRDELRRRFEAERCDHERAREARFGKAHFNPQESKPQHLFDLASKNATISSILQVWRNGDLTLEQCLIFALSHLVKENEHLVKQLCLLSPTGNVQTMLPAGVPTETEADKQVPPDRRDFKLKMKQILVYAEAHDIIELQKALDTALAVRIREKEPEYAHTDPIVVTLSCGINVMQSDLQRVLDNKYLGPKELTDLLLARLRDRLTS